MKYKPAWAAPAASLRSSIGASSPTWCCSPRRCRAAMSRVGAVLTRKWIFDKVFDRMDRAVVHGSTFAKNDMAMAAGLATLDVLESEKLIENAARKASVCWRAFTDMVPRYELIKEVRGKGFMIGIEFGAPRSFDAEGVVERARERRAGSVLSADHDPAVQGPQDSCAGRGPRQPYDQAAAVALITDDDCDWIEDASRRSSPPRTAFRARSGRLARRWSAMRYAPKPPVSRGFMRACR